MAQRLNCGRVNEEQKSILVEFLENHKEMVSGNLTRTFTNADKIRLWQQLTNILNAVGTGATKNEESWKGCWGDIKSNLKKKLSKFKKSIEQTGGGFADANPITEFEDRVAALMGDSTVFGIPGAKESGSEAFTLVADSPPYVQVIACQPPQASDCEAAVEGASSCQVVTTPGQVVTTPSQVATTPRQVATPRQSATSLLTSASPSCPTLATRPQCASNTFARRRNVKRVLNRNTKLEEAASAVGSFASAQDRQSKAIEAIASALKKQTELEEEKLLLKRRKVEAEEKKAEAEERKAAALEGILQICVSKFS